MGDEPLLGSVEAGGTKFVCAVGSGPHDVRARVRIPTTTPQETLGGVVSFFHGAGPVEAIGIASFGPLELRRGHPDYGHLTTTPKPGWGGADVVGPIASGVGVPVAIDTDVTGAALGEWTWGAGRDVRNLVYVTVGTGIGGGAVIDGRPVPGLVHAEMGHVQVARQAGDDFPGSCPYHGVCLEGLAAGPALEGRWGKPAEELGHRPEVVALEAAYLASGLRSVVYVLAPERILVGGGVANLPGLVEQVGRRLVDEMSGYAVLPEHHDGFVVPPALGADAGMAGGFALASAALGIPTAG